jgi:glucose/arabinose dehydrogenase
MYDNSLLNVGTSSTPLSTALGNSDRLILVDSRVANYQSLLQGARSSEIVLLDAQTDGISQITAALSDRGSIASIHILAHGSAGALQLGNTVLNAATLARHQSEISTWNQSLTAEGDMLLYGCEVAAGDSGVAFVQALAAVTGADIAASTNLTGQGGDWRLEVATGAIEAGQPFTTEGYTGTLATYNGNTYQLTASLTWEQAQAEAQRLGGNLVTINNAAEETWLKQTFGGTESFWIGLNDRTTEGQFVWASGEAVSYTNWAPGEPNNSGGNEDVVGMNFGGSRRWNDWGAANRFRGVVEIPGTTPPPTDFTYNGGTYRLTAPNLTWEEAQTAARQAGGNLVTVNDAAENNWLVQTFGGTEGLWIGITDRTTEGQFAWASGAGVSYTNWAPGEPNNAGGNQDYGWMNYSAPGLWDDRGASDRLRGIIEIRQTQPPQEVFTYNGKQYRLTSAGTWNEAQTAAQGFGGNLVTINDAAEEAWLRQTFGTSDLWIGLNDQQVEGSFVWANGEAVTYTNWTPGEPNNVGSGEDFAAMNFNGSVRWNDWGAASRFRGIVEIGSTPPPTGTIALEQGTYSINEAGGTLEIGISRSGSTTGSATVQYRADNGTAIAGSDFTASSGTLTFADGQSRGVVRIPILNDTAVEGNETFTFVIQAPTGANLGTLRTATITIVDNDSNGLTINPVQVSENAGNAVITVTRGNSNGTASVNFVTQNGTAIAGSDYESRSGQITFANGVTSQTISIPILDNSVTEPNETFQVNFSNPVGVTLTNSSVAVTILDNDSGTFIKESVITGLTQPTGFARTPGDELMFIIEKRGIVKVAQGSTVLATPFIDIQAEVNNVSDRGLLGIAVHPDFYNGSPYVYLAYAYDPPEAFQNTNPGTNLDEPDQRGNRPMRVVRLTADASANYARAVAGSQQVILGKNSTWANTSGPDRNSTTDFNVPESGRTAGGGYVQDYVKVDSESHMGGSLAFGADGALYISTGDGTSYNAVDPRTISTLTPDSLSGKILRVNPLTGDGFGDNPFANGDLSSNRSKVWNLGLRNPFRTVMKPGTSTLFIGDVGWKTWEEVNVSTRGANFGWAAYEGGNGGTSLVQPEYRNVQAFADFINSGQAVVAPIYARNHSEGARAIAMGDFYNGELYIADVNEGTIDALTINAQNQLVSVRRFASNTPGIVYLEAGSDNSLYYVDIGSGAVGRWRPA